MGNNILRCPYRQQIDNFFQNHYGRYLPPGKLEGSEGAEVHVYEGGDSFLLFEATSSTDKTSFYDLLRYWFCPHGVHDNMKMAEVIGLACCGSASVIVWFDISPNTFLFIRVGSFALEK